MSHFFPVFVYVRLHTKLYIFGLLISFKMKLRNNHLFHSQLDMFIVNTQTVNNNYNNLMNSNDIQIIKMIMISKIIILYVLRMGNQNG